MFNKGKKQLRKAAPVVALALIPMLTMAAGFQINENSPRLQGQAMAGSGSDAGDVTAIFNNPAILGSLNTDNIYVGGSYISPNVSMHNAKATHSFSDGIDPATPAGLESVTGKDDQSSVAAGAFVPVLYADKVLGHGLVAGFSVTAPWGMSTNYDNNSVVRFMALETSLKTVNMSPMLAWKVNDDLSVAAGFQAQYADAEFSNYDGIQANSPIAPWVPNMVTDHPTDVAGNGWAYGYTLGVLFKPAKNTHIGISYRSELDYDLKGTANQYTVKGEIPPALPPSTDTPYNSSTPATASFVTPAVLNLSITQKINSKWVVSSTEQVTFWHSLQSIKIKMPKAYATETDMDLNWQDSWMVSLGAEYLASKQLTLRSGVAYDQTPTNDTDRDVRIPDSNRTWLTFGGTYQINHRFTVDAAYEHIFMQDQKIDATQNVGVHKDVDPLEINNVQADFSGSASIFALGINYKF